MEGKHDRRKHIHHAHTAQTDKHGSTGGDTMPDVSAAATESLDGWRDRLSGVPNWLVQLSNVAMVVAGVAAWLSTVGPVAILGIVCAGMGAVGILDRVAREVK